MKKTLIALSIASTLTPTLVFADTSPTRAQDTETILVTSNPYNQSIDEIMSTVSIINRVDIDRIQPKSVAELLQTTAGIDIAANGGPAQVTSAFVRGTNSTHTLFLVDGVRIDTVTGSGGASVNDIPTYQIERIEIVKGPRAAMYGSDAVGAVIQIFTRKLASGEFNAALEYGSNNYQFAGVAAGISHGEGASTLSVSREKSNGYDVTDNAYSVDDDKDEYEKTNISLKGQQALNEALTLNWVGRYDDGSYDYDGNSSYTVLAPKQKYKKHLLSTGLSYNQAQWSHNLSLAQYQEKQQRLGDYPANNQTTRNQVNYDSTYNAENNLSYNFGGQLYQDKYDGNGSFDGQSRDSSSIFLSAFYEEADLLTELSVRYNDVEDTGSEVTYNVSAGYNISESVFASINYGTGFKTPTFYQLYDSWSGNQALKLETSESWELLLRSTIAGVETELSYFHLDFDNLLDYDYSSYTYANIADAAIAGVELNLAKRIDDLSLSANYAYTDTEDKNTGTQLSRRARHKANVEAVYTWEKVTFSTSYKYHGIRFDAYSNSTLKSYGTVNISANYLLNEKWKLQVKANNITDETYRTAPGYIPPGAEVFLQVSYSNQ
ncbi:TonB-dependent vitamin B12 receptor BtuB [Colwellia sp. KU-HH00111]|uniref:TonB-dependent receptor domain-containing protein n=1 Tax=Colwellia sp. KU-HH00111 TaxID=3127652 RepID=UPI003101DD87